ncbi:MAG: 4-hydroxy-tetrahydrodipicolinate reductase [bacterium]|nr:MAG: 4-hydroxy-tetrahydrodipicolinate reductase [bacterium]
MIRAALSGACGRMGTAIIRALGDTDGITLSGALEREGHPDEGRDAGDVAGMGDVGVMVTVDPFALLESANVDVLIDFSAPQAALINLEGCADRGIAAVVGTTGFSPEQTEALQMFAQRTAMVLSPNMSVGVNVLFKIAQSAVGSLGPGYDAEIVEAHHRMKKDAPSGTALRLAEVVAGTLGRSLEQHAVYARKGVIGQRTDEEIGIQTVRGGDIVGEHTLILAGPGERLELTHRAHSRDNFARGAVRAALWVFGKPSGLYSMEDVLELE